jgi:hypothetical protein
MLFYRKPFKVINKLKWNNLELPKIIKNNLG